MSRTVSVGYLSRSQIKEYLSFILENGAESILETSDGVYSDAPMGHRVGAAISSVKEFHLKRSLGDLPDLRQGSCVLLSGSDKPELLAGTEVVGIFYMSKLGKDFSAGLDQYPDFTFAGDIGDVAWVKASDWEKVSFSEAISGTCYRLIVFWTAS